MLTKAQRALLHCLKGRLGPPIACPPRNDDVLKFLKRYAQFEAESRKSRLVCGGLCHALCL